MVIEPCQHCNKYHTGVQCGEIKATTIADCHSLYGKNEVKLKKTEYVTKEKYQRLESELAECKAERDFNIKRVNDISYDAEVELKEVYSERDALRARCERLEGALRNVLAIGTVLKDDTPEKPSVIFGHPDHKQWPAIFLAAKQALEVPRE